MIAQIHEYKGRQELYLKQKPAVLGKLVEIAKIQSTEASNKIEGIVTTSTRVQQLCEEKTTPRNSDEEEIMGYRDVLNTIHESYEYIWVRASYILQLHRDLFKYSERAIGGEVSFYSVMLGLLFGILTMFSNFCKLTALSKGPMHITVLLTTSSMIIPAMSGVVLFDEKFSILKAFAILVLIFFIYISFQKEEGTELRKGWIIYSALAFIFQGMIGVVQKIHQSSAYKNELFVFLATSFLFSFIFSGILAKREKSSLKMGKKQYAFAIICGICTFIMNFLNLKLSGIMPGQIFFPLVNGGSIILTSMVSIAVFKEKITKRQALGIAGGLISLLLICIL